MQPLRGENADLRPRVACVLTTTMQQYTRASRITRGPCTRHTQKRRTGFIVPSSTLHSIHSLHVVISRGTYTRVTARSRRRIIKYGRTLNQSRHIGEISNPCHDEECARALLFHERVKSKPTWPVILPSNGVTLNSARLHKLNLGEPV